MPIDGRLASRREVTGRALGTVGLVEGTFVEVDDMLDNAPPGGSGKVNKFILPNLELLASDNIETTITTL